MRYPVRVLLAEPPQRRYPPADKAKQALFDRLANHLTVLANQVEQAMLDRKTV